MMEKAYLITYKTNIKKVLENKIIDRFYVWDGECDFNFIYFLKKEFYIKLLLLCKKKITIITPYNFKDKNIKQFKRYLIDNLELIKRNEIEIVINDWWTLWIIEELGLNNSIVFWYHMYNQKRDLLSYHFFNIEKEKKELIWNTSIDFLMYNSFLRKKGFKSVDLFNFSIFQWFNNLELPVNLYYPNIVFSITGYCYNNALTKKDKHLSITSACSGCKWKEGSFIIKWQGLFPWIDKNSKNFSEEYFTQYSSNKYSYKDFSLKLLNNKKINVDRIVYNYDL